MKCLGLLLLIAGIAVGSGGLYLLFGFTVLFKIFVGFILTATLVCSGVFLMLPKSSETQ